MRCPQNPELRLAVDVACREGTRDDTEAICLLQEAEHVPRQRTFARLVPEAKFASAWPHVPAIASAISSRPAITLSERLLEHIGRRGAEADGRIADRDAALLVVVVLPGEPGVVVTDQWRENPAVAATVDEARVVPDQSLDDLLVELAPAVGGA